MIIYQGDGYVVQAKPIIGFAVGIRFEDDLVGEGSKTLCFDLVIFTLFFTW